MTTKQTKKPWYQSSYIWAFTTYFTEGFPYAIIRSVSSVFFRSMKVSLESIGLVSLFGLPWTLKFLWGPWVDEYGTKRRWLLSMQGILTVIFALTAIFAPLENSVQLIAVLFLVGAFIAATHDIAIDGYYMEALDKEGQAKFVGYRTMAFRIAWMTGTGAIVTIGAKAGWFAAFLVSAVIFALFFIYHIFYLKEVETAKVPMGKLFLKVFRLKPFFSLLSVIILVVGVRYFFQSQFYSGLKAQAPILAKFRFAHGVALLLLLALLLVWALHKKIRAAIVKDSESHYSRAFIYFMEREKVGLILAFIILLRIGEWTLSNMVAPFIVDLGIIVHYGWLSAGVGLPASIVGAVLGGWMISRYSLKSVMWPFILAQNFTNIVYMLVAWRLSKVTAVNQWVMSTIDEMLPWFSIEPIGLGAKDLTIVAFTHGFDQFAGGLGTAVLMTYLMRICHIEYKAAHYAIGTGLMNLSAPFAGVFAGIIAGWLGYTWLFGLSFVASIPAMLLIPFLPYMEKNEN